MDRTTRKVLDNKVDYLNRRTGKEFYVQSAYGQGYRLYEVYAKGREHDLTTHRLSATEMRWFLDGMITFCDMYAKDVK